MYGLTAGDGLETRAFAKIDLEDVGAGGVAGVRDERDDLLSAGAEQEAGFVATERLLAQGQDSLHGAGEHGVGEHLMRHCSEVSRLGVNWRVMRCECDRHLSVACPDSL